MALIKQPYISSIADQQAFIEAMVRLGARYNGTYDGWNLDDNKVQDAQNIIARLPTQQDILNTRPINASGQLFNKNYGRK